jgi:uncharacterized protein (TIGR04255 family)
MTYARPKSLPDFERPPIDEVVLSVQFGDVALRNVHIGLLWQRFKTEYPNVEEQAPIAPTFETFGALQAAPPNSIQLLPFDQMARFWFVSEDQNELIQIQRDRLIHNWRLRRPEDKYPRYEILRTKFESEILKFDEFIEQEKLGSIQVNQCEVSYINVIGPVSSGDDPTKEIDRIFTVWREAYSDKYLKRSERARFNSAFLMQDTPDSPPDGRLHVGVVPSIRTHDQAPVLRVTLTARGKPRDESIAGAFHWLDKGRETVVRGFASITTKEMHKIWGRKVRR